MTGTLSDVRLLRLATAGSVDDGKSTLVGRLLLDSDSVFADQYDALAATGTVDLALLTDGLRAEREQGITIDVAYRYFSTATRRFVLADTPGHVQYNRNTISGMSAADVAVVLVDARRSVQDQTRRHLATAALLRVPHVAIAVNKMDAVDYQADRFTQVAEDVLGCAWQLGVADPVVIPVSALAGDNIVRRSSTMDWYGGPTLLEHLERVPVTPIRSTGGAARLSVQCVLKDDGGAGDVGRSYAGRLTSGPLAVGDEVVVLPSGRSTRVRALGKLGAPVDSAFPGDSVEVTVADHVDVSRGDLIARPAAPSLVDSFRAVVCAVSERAVRPGEHVLVKHGTRTVRALLHEIHAGLDLASLRYLPGLGAVAGNDIALVTVRTAEPLPVEDHADDRETGSFLLLDPDDGGTLAAGMVGAATDRRADDPR
ncbi:sulfate adenylyltransferase subunit 1 [Actinokineospora enzanensis]|uniref:sulfate adenylyltransferase subunit 1 n=1 Tax=Actinokineospora enzanensis TaxID=155975 RepID=UPI000366A922|nr:GTP-binding protein [Actinokineospora enzanensis]